MNLRTLVEKSPDADLLREMIGFAAQRLTELEVESPTGAAYGEKNPEHLAQRNGYRDRAWEMRAGAVELRIPKLRKAPTFRASWSRAAWPRKRSRPGTGGLRARRFDPLSGRCGAGVPAPASDQPALDQPDRAPQRRDQAADRGGRHLPQRRRDRSPRWRDPA
jgi:hypothetical protein